MRSAVLAALATGPQQLADLVRAAGAPVPHVQACMHALVLEGVIACTRTAPPASLLQAEHGPNDRARLWWHLKDAPRPTYAPAPLAPDVPEPVDRIVATRRLRKAATPFSDDKPGPMEILARMAGRTTFRTPRREGVITVPVTPLDIAHAIATAEDKLGSAVATAIACRRPQDFPKVVEHAYEHDRLIKAIRGSQRQAGVVDAPHTYRARIALHDAFHDLIAGPACEKKRNLSQAARDARMRRSLYLWLLRTTTAFLEAAANTAAGEAVKFLFALAAAEHGGKGRVRAVSIRAGTILVWTDRVPTAAADEYVLSIADLCEDVLQRPRRAGVLALNTTTQE